LLRGNPGKFSIFLKNLEAYKCNLESYYAEKIIKNIKIDKKIGEGNLREQEGRIIFQNYLLPLYYFDKILLKSKKMKQEDTIFLVGTPRSGTTWLMELLENIPSYTYLFEPLHSIWFPEVVKIDFKSRPYLLKDRERIEWEEYLRKIFTGKVVNRMPLYGFKPKMLMNRLLSKKLIVKSVRLTRLLPWIAERFQLRSAFYIIRHPCATIASQLKTGFFGYHNYYPPYLNARPSIDNIISEASHMNFVDPELIEKLKKMNTIEEILTAAWCLDNYIPLNEPKTQKWTTLLYEKLVADGESEIKRLCKTLNHEEITEIATQQLRKPSIVTLGDEKKKLKSIDIQLSKWKKQFNQDQIDRMLKILSDFGLDFYSEENEPDYNHRLLKGL
jgi:hypothetical protein